jgi:hypothetical protein
MNSHALITGVLLVVVFVAGFFVGRYTSFAPSTVADAIPNTISDVAQSVQPSNSTATNGTASGGTAASANTGMTINLSSLSDSQRAMLKTFGITGDTVTLTPAMMACAEAKVGAARIEEIKNGATPSFSEGASLIACYR